MSTPEQPTLQSVVAAEYADIRDQANGLANGGSAQADSSLRELALRFSDLTAGHARGFAPGQHSAAHDALLGAVGRMQRASRSSRQTTTAVALLTRPTPLSATLKHMLRSLAPTPGRTTRRPVALCWTDRGDSGLSVWAVAPGGPVRAGHSVSSVPHPRRTDR